MANVTRPLAPVVAARVAPRMSTPGWAGATVAAPLEETGTAGTFASRTAMASTVSTEATPASIIT